MREASEVRFRKDVQKPNNIAVQQFLTDQRLKENRDDRASPDDRFNVWSVRA